MKLLVSDGDRVRLQVLLENFAAGRRSGAVHEGRPARWPEVLKTRPSAATTAFAIEC